MDYNSFGNEKFSEMDSGRRDLAAFAPHYNVQGLPESKKNTTHLGGVLSIYALHRRISA
jgi:hypothetical protein